MRDAIKILIIVIVVFAFVDPKVYGYDYNRGPVAPDLYGDTPKISATPVITLDFTYEDTYLGFAKTANKSIRDDFGNFAKASLTPYIWNWTERVIFDGKNVREVFTEFPGGWIDNVSGWQVCKLIYCSYPHEKRPFWNPPPNDGDPFHINYIEHPVSGAANYLYFRAMGFDRLSSLFGSFLESALFEYTIEGFQQPPSMNDVLVTPLLGVPLGMALEVSSDWLSQRDSHFLRVVGYLVNPFKLMSLGREVSYQNMGGVSIRFNWY